MYHSKTPDDVKKFIRKDMEAENRSIRVLVSTSSAGMGVNFSPPRDMDTFIQQMGRAGRDGKFFQELIFYKSLKNQIINLDHKMMKIITTDSDCRREIIAECYFTKKHVKL